MTKASGGRHIAESAKTGTWPEVSSVENGVVIHPVCENTSTATMMELAFCVIEVYCEGAEAREFCITSTRCHNVTGSLWSTMDSDQTAIRKRMADLVAEAGKNETILRRAQARELRLLESASLEELFDNLVDGLARSY
ncbi:MAG: hypothetical protein AAF465_06595, partial [Pseudomonadota bacterium]